MGHATLATTNITLVAWLSYNDVQPTEIAFIDGQCEWTYERDERVSELVGQYSSRKAMAEIRKFSQSMIETRHQLAKARSKRG